MDNERVYPDGSFEEIPICPICEEGPVLYFRRGPHIQAKCEFCGNHIKFVGQYHTPEAWSRKIKEDAGYTCARCGKTTTSRGIHAHHLLPKWFMPEREFSITNGICLCNNCHKLIHGKDGTINNKKPNNNNIQEV